MKSQSAGLLIGMVLAGCVVLGPNLQKSIAQAPSPTAQTNASEQRPLPKFELYTLYSFLGINNDVTTTRNGAVTKSFSPIPLGGILGSSYFFNRHWGANFEYSAHPDGENDGVQSLQGGVIYRFPHTNWTPFVHALGGAAKMGGPNVPSLQIYHDYTWGGSGTGGGGLDYRPIAFCGRLGLRPIQADYVYYHADYPEDPTGQLSGGTTNSSTYRISSGLYWVPRGCKAPEAIQYSCAATPASVFPGEPVTVQGTATGLKPKAPEAYEWNGAGATGSGSATTIDTSRLAPGTYTVNGRVSQGAKAVQSAGCSAQFVVRAYEPPTVTCIANPTTVPAGGSATITAKGVSPQNRPLTYSYNATAGSISGVTPSAILSTTGAAPGPITVTCGVVDDTGKQATATTTVSVLAPPPPPPPPAAALPITSSLCTTSFERDKARPVRVDNEAKACLDDVTMSLQQNPNAKLALVGTEDAKEARRSKGRVAAQRAADTKDYLVTDKGIDASRIMLYTSTADSETVTTTLVPLGATLDPTGLTPVDESKVKVERRKPIQ